MATHNIGLFVPLAIVLLIIWLIFSIKKRIKLIIQDEIYDDFPAIRDQMANFERRLDFLKAQLEQLEAKLKELKDKADKG